MKIVKLKMCKNMSIIILSSLVLSACGSRDGGGAVSAQGASRVFAPTISISASPSAVAYNTGTSITWSTSSNTTSCSSSPSGIVGLSGTYPITNLTKTTTYVLTCVGPGGTTRVSQQISVAGSAITSFTDVGDGATTIVTSANDLNLSNIDDNLVTITGTNNYNGTYTVPSVTSTTFIMAMFRLSNGV